MHGNVYEMTADWYDAHFALRSERRDPHNGARPAGRLLVVTRGGSYASLAEEARSANRETIHLNNRHDDVGVRLVLAENGE